MQLKQLFFRVAHLVLVPAKSAFKQVTRTVATAKVNSETPDTLWRDHCSYIAVDVNFRALVTNKAVSDIMKMEDQCRILISFLLQLQWKCMYIFYYTYTLQEITLLLSHPYKHK